MKNSKNWQNLFAFAFDNKCTKQCYLFQTNNVKTLLIYVPKYFDLVDSEVTLALS